MTGKPGSCLFFFFFLLNGQERPSKKVTADKDMKCMSELIICLDKSIPNKKKRKRTKAKPTAKVQTSVDIIQQGGQCSWKQREEAEGREAEGREAEGGRQRAVGDEVRRVAYQPSTTIRVLDFIPVWEIMGAIGERTDMV